MTVIILAQTPSFKIIAIFENSEFRKMEYFMLHFFNKKIVFNNHNLVHKPPGEQFSNSEGFMLNK